jgi:hypothetical protein
MKTIYVTDTPVKVVNDGTGCILNNVGNIPVKLTVDGQDGYLVLAPLAMLSELPTGDIYASSFRGGVGAMITTTDPAIS